MAKLCISKPIFPIKSFNAFISCVSKHNLIQEFSSAVLREGPLVPRLKEYKRRQLVHSNICGQSWTWFFKLLHRENEPWAATCLPHSPEVWACGGTAWLSFGKGATRQMSFISDKTRSAKSSLCPLRTLTSNSTISNVLSDEPKQSWMVLGKVTEESSSTRGH